MKKLFWVLILGSTVGCMRAEDNVVTNAASTAVVAASSLSEDVRETLKKMEQRLVGRSIGHIMIAVYLQVINEKINARLAQLKKLLGRCDVALDGGSNGNYQQLLQEVNEFVRACEVEGEDVTKGLDSLNETYKNEFPLPAYKKAEVAS